MNKRGRPKRTQEYQMYWDIIKIRKLVYDVKFSKKYSFDIEQKFIEFEKIFVILEQQYQTNKTYNNDDNILFQKYKNLSQVLINNTEKI